MLSRADICLTSIASAAIFLLAACAGPAPAWHGTPYDPPRAASEFTLDGMHGSPVELADLAGQPLLLYFGYTSCPDFCPVTLADLSWVFSQLGPSGGAAHVLFVTVDPVQDTDERLIRYLQKFNPDFVGARAPDQATLDAMLAAYGAFAEQDPSDDQGQEDLQGLATPHGHGAEAGSSPAFTHSARVFLIGADGKLITHYAFGTPREEILADLRQALKQGG